MWAEQFYFEQFLMFPQEALSGVSRLMVRYIQLQSADALGSDVSLSTEPL
jgi:hypothetical protein